MDSASCDFAQDDTLRYAQNDSKRSAAGMERSGIPTASALKYLV